MGRKKEDSGGKQKRNAKNAIDTEPMVSTGDLEAVIKKLKAELEREQNERKWYQLECDRIRSFWDITKLELDNTKRELLDLEATICETEAAHQREIEVFRQKVKHLLNEHKLDLEELNTENTTTLKLAGEQQRTVEIDLRRQKRALKEKLKQQQLAHQDYINLLNKGRAEIETVLTEDNRRRETEIETRYKQKLQLLKDELELRSKTELHELEERKNSQITTLIKNHEQALFDIKAYYKDITLNSLALITALKEKVVALSRRDDKIRQQLAEQIGENRQIMNSLQRAKADAVEAERRTSTFEGTKKKLELKSKQLEHSIQQLKDSELTKEVLIQQKLRLEKNSRDLMALFTNAVLEVGQKANFKNLLLENKLKAVDGDFEILEAQMNTILTAANIDPESIRHNARKVEDMLHEKNRTIEDLKYELAKASKAHNDLINAYESTLHKFGIRVEETGFITAISKLKGQVLGTGPSGLVSQPI